MFFELHDEKKIGYKKLSDADLGLSPTSHQTHIGLSEHVLRFLPDRDAINEDSIFIYKDSFEYIDAYFDRIENPDGTFRSPKIKIGERGCISVVSTIREIVKSTTDATLWYLIWFGLKNDKIVFFLFDDNSADYEQFAKLGLSLDSTGTKSIDGSEAAYSQLIAYIEQKINRNGKEILKQLEIMTQTNTVIPNKKYRLYDIQKANEVIERVGREGEEFVAKHFDNLVKAGRLVTYTWYNRDKESGLPYDFSIQDSNNDIIYLDVKTTSYNFEQDMIFSSQEIEYIAKTQNPYSIYRVYKNDSEAYSMSICNDCKSLSIDINRHTKLYSDNLREISVSLLGSKLAIAPTLSILQFRRVI